jgi:hypothetical protein
MEVNRSQSETLGAWITRMDSVTSDKDFFETILNDEGLTLSFSTGSNYSFIPAETF